MPLSASEVARFQRDGYLFPFDVVTRADVASARAGIEAWERTLGGPVPKERRQKPHLFMTFLDAIVHAPEVLDRVESIIGPDILCWESVLFIKEPGTADFISWHQDATYWGLSKPDVCTAWIALSPANKISGCMKFIPGTHKAQVKHDDTFDKNNLLTRGQEIAVEVDESKAVYGELKPGEASLHRGGGCDSPAPPPSRRSRRRRGSAGRCGCG